MNLVILFLAKSLTYENGWNFKINNFTGEDKFAENIQTHRSKINLLSLEEVSYIVDANTQRTLYLLRLKM